MVAEYTQGTIVDGYTYPENPLMTTIDANHLATISSVIPTIGTANEHSVALSPDGTLLAVSNEVLNTVSIYSVPAYPPTGTYTLLNTATVGSTPKGVIFTPNGKQIWIGNSGGNTVSIIAVPSWSVTTLTVSSGSNTREIIFSPDGNTAYIDDVGANAVWVYNANTLAKIGSISTNAGPDELLWMYNYTQLWVTENSNGTVGVLDPVGMTEIGTMPVSAKPHSIALSPNGQWVYVSDNFNNALTIFQILYPGYIPTSATATIQPGGASDGLCFSQDSSTCYIMGAGGQNAFGMVINVAEQVVTNTFTMDCGDGEDICMNQAGTIIYLPSNNGILPLTVPINQTPSGWMDVVGSNTTTYDTSAGTILVYFSVTATLNGTLTSIGVNLATSGNGNVTLGLYRAPVTGSAPVPTTLLAKTASTSVSGVTGWYDIPVISGTPITAGTSYYIAFEFNAANALYAGNPLGTKYTQSNTYASGLPTTASVGSKTINASPNMRITYGIPVVDTINSIPQFPTGISTTQVQAYRIVASKSGPLISIGAYLNIGLSNIMMALYSDSSGSPGTLLASTSAAAPGSNVWIDCPATSNFQVVAGTAYWLAIQSAGPGVDDIFIQFGSGGNQCTYTNTYGSFQSSPTWNTSNYGYGFTMRMTY